MTWGEKFSIVALFPMSICILIGLMLIVLGFSAGVQWEAILLGTLLLAISLYGDFLLLKRLRIL